MAIVSNLVTGDIKKNQNRILQLATKAVDSGAEFILFPETAATGLIISGNPERDFTIAETIPGLRNEQWSSFAAEHGTYFGAGLLEQDGNRIFDSAVLFDRDGELILHYRRNDPGWHSPDDDSKIYCEGYDIPVIDSPIGRLAFLVCGDLWNDEILGRLQAKHPDYLLYIFARDIFPMDQVEQIWESEFSHYKNRWMRSGSTVIATNLLCNIQGSGSIGGIWVIDRRRAVLKESSILHENMLLIDL